MVERRLGQASFMGGRGRGWGFGLGVLPCCGQSVSNEQGMGRDGRRNRDDNKTTTITPTRDKTNPCMPCNAMPGPLAGIGRHTGSATRLCPLAWLTGLADWRVNSLPGLVCWATARPCHEAGWSFYCLLLTAYGRTLARLLVWPPRPSHRRGIIY